MKFNSVTPELLEIFREIVGEAFVKTAQDAENFADYGRDMTEDLSFAPEVVLVPETAEQVSQIVKICYEHSIPVTPRGAGTGLSGGALPLHGGVVISTEKLNRIIEIDERNLQATVEPGVINQVFQDVIKGPLDSKIILMNAAILVKQEESFKYVRLTPILRALPPAKKKTVQPANKTRNEKKKTPQFYTEPIFRARTHDFL